jgi:GH24 family phage-related lysozyme (muramidase)
MSTVGRTLRRWIKVPVTTYMFNALILLSMNAGLGNFRDGATDTTGQRLPSVLSILNEGRYAHACHAFHNHRFGTKVIKDPVTGLAILDETGNPKTEIVELVGLSNRRADERSLFLTKIDRI